MTVVGGIIKGDFQRFKSAIKKVADGGGIVTHVYIYSPGGSVDEAIKIGRLISRLAISTNAPGYNPQKPEERYCNFREHTTNTQFTDHKWYYNKYSRTGNRKCNCASACFLIWAAGARRAGNYLGVHRTFFKPESFKKDSYQVARKRYVRMRRVVENYLEEMNVPNLVVDTMFSIGSNKIEPLAPNFVNILQGGPALDEYLRAHCPTETLIRDGHKTALEALKSVGVKNKASIAKAEKAYNDAYVSACRCEIKVRRDIFKAAWAKEAS